jgi:hypothetical protein
MEQAERIDKPRIDEILEAFPLLVGEAVLADVRLRIGEIVRRMGDIEVAAEDDRLPLLQFLAIREEGRIPLLVAEREAAEVRFGMGVYTVTMKNSRIPLRSRASESGSP